MTAKRDWWNKEFKIMSAFGESITAGGWASNRERCWANRLAKLINEYQRMPVQLINVGVGANVISPQSPGYEFSHKPSALERVERDVLRYTANGHQMQPDLLVISYGMNDARSGTSIELFCREMRQILAKIRAEIQPLIVLVGPYYMTGFDRHGTEWAYADLETFEQYNEAIRALAKEEECLFADVLHCFNNADWLVHHDTVHSNDLGHALVANKIFEVLASNCSGLSLETRHLEDFIEPWRDESILDIDR